uniref:CCHC-type domain-containing protein n=1 Tax=Oryza punctata TaxID=4537 RepID=A0A0E0KGD1_ORYPU
MVKSGGSKSNGGSHHGSDEEESIVCHHHVRHMLDRVDVNHLNVVSMMLRMRVRGCILTELLIIAVFNNLLAQVLLFWTRLLMIFTMTTGIIMLLVFHWMKGLRDSDGSVTTKSVSFKPATTSRDGSKPIDSSASKSQSKVGPTAASGSKLRSVECYTCGGRRHYMRDYPNQKKVLITREVYISESLSENSEGVQLDYI